MIGRRGFITGLVSLVAAPAIVRAGSLMPVKAMTMADELALINARIHHAMMQANPTIRVLAEFGDWETAVKYAAGQVVRIGGCDAMMCIR